MLNVAQKSETVFISGKTPQADEHLPAEGIIKIHILCSALEQNQARFARQLFLNNCYTSTREQFYC